MADMPDDEEPETFVQKAVKIGLIAIPLMMYVSWAHKKFVPCPRVKCQQARPSLFKTSVTKGKRKNKKSKCQDSRADKQERKRDKCENACKDSRSAKQENKRGNRQDSKSYEPDYEHQLSWLCETNEKDIEPSKDIHIDYLKRSTSDCCKPVNKHVSGHRNSNKTECKQSEADPSESNAQSEAISPEAFDKLFEQHFQQCVDDFKQHKQRLEKELERLKQDCEAKQKNRKPESNKNCKYLECLTDLNLDKDFECDPNFHSTDIDTPYVVKDYKCKATKGTATKGSKADKNETSGSKQSKAGYLECLADLNIDKHFEEKQETQSYFEEKISKNECCPSSKIKGYDKTGDTVRKKTDECETDSYNTKKDYNRNNTKTQELQEEELCKNETQSGEHKPKGTLEEYKRYTNVEIDDCGCDPHFNTKDTDKYGHMNSEPCAYRAVREDNIDNDALKDFWNACGPPKGLRTGCQGKGCNDPCEKRK